MSPTSPVPEARTSAIAAPMAASTATSSAGAPTRRRNMHYEVLGDPIFRERDVPRMLSLARARADGDTSVPAELVNYAARSRVSKQARGQDLD